MPGSYSTTRRHYLKGVTVAGVAGLTGLSTSASATQGGPVQMGSILPITGNLSAFGSGMQEAVNLAAQDVNDADGPLGRRINVSNTDSQTAPSQAIQQYNTLVNEQNIVGFVGGAASAVSTPLAQNVAQDRVMQVSNASTTPVLSEIGFNEDESVKYFGRTAPNDGQQGIVMGRILSADEFIGADTAAFLFRGDPYGEGLASKASEAFEGETVGMIPYDEQASDFTSTLDSLFENDPEAIGFVGFPGESRTILNQWNNGGYGGEWVLSEGLNDPGFLTELSDIVAGMFMASPDPEATTGAETFQEKFGSDSPTLFAPHAYDALFLMALAIEAAGEASGTAIARNIRSVSREGETVTVGEFQKAKDLLANGTDIDYQGASSPVDLNEKLEPLNQFAILQVQEDGSTEKLETIPRSEFEGQL
ncbi:ABC transporter substrate-binding protein [Halorussus salinisoli]|uniref:ABC transporter substrate-binding protein n=1 Tax=Halorussus salinisoli TaxID=2558242 RepID=UPI0010C1B8DC|nr:ABC transporter substrate-binding protein [Halorussus salinisoli]